MILYLCNVKHNLQDCIGSRLRRLSRITDGYYRKQLSNFSITENQLTILFALRKMGKIEQGKIGQALVLERSTVSRNVKLLEKKDFIIKTIGNRPEIELSKKGNELVQTLIPLWENAMDDLIEKIGGKGMQYIRELEKKLS